MVNQATRREIRVLRRESDIVRDAIALVASGAASRVVIAGLKFGGEVIDPARGAALEAGLRVRALARSADDGIDLAIEPITE